MVRCVAVAILVNVNTFGDDIEASFSPSLMILYSYITLARYVCTFQHAYVKRSTNAIH